MRSCWLLGLAAPTRCTRATTPQPAADTSQTGSSPKISHWLGLPKLSQTDIQGESFFLPTRTIIFHRWVTDTKFNDSDETKSVTKKTMPRLLIVILLMIGNVELNPGPDSNVFLLTFLYLWGLYAHHANSNGSVFSAGLSHYQSDPPHTLIPQP